MNIEIQISFSENSIVLQSGDTTKRFANLIGIDQATHNVVAIGHTEQEFAIIKPKIWEEYKHKIVFEPVFEIQKFDAEKMIWATWTLVGNFYYKLHRIKLFDKIICYVTIPNYEGNEIKVREHYEIGTERVFHQLNKMTVNGKTVISKDWKYNLAKDSLELIPMFVMLLFLFWRDQISVMLNSDSPLFPVYLLILVLLGFSAFWTIQIVWMLGMQLLFPKRMVYRIFGHKIRTPPDKFSVSRILANWVLGKYE
jgi:hypothetical protein